MDGKVMLPPSPPPPQHQVFINFRGEELRNNFISHLVDAFERNEINTFTDNKEQRGEDITNLFKRIEQSKISIAVFSKRYTESRWCLDELVKIKERVDLGNLKVLPIFYNVSTYDVKNLEGEFGIHFRRLEREYRPEKPKIDKWKEALAYVSGKIGLTFDDRSLSESHFIGKIIKDILIMLQSIPSSQDQNSLTNLETPLRTIDYESGPRPKEPEQPISSRYQEYQNRYDNSMGKGETSTIKKHLMAQKGNLETPSQAIDYEFGPRPKVPEPICPKYLEYQNRYLKSLGRGETSTIKNDSKKHLKAQKGNLEIPLRAIDHEFGPRPKEPEPPFKKLI